MTEPLLNNSEKGIELPESKTKDDENSTSNNNYDVFDEIKLENQNDTENHSSNNNNNTDNDNNNNNNSNNDDDNTNDNANEEHHHSMDGIISFSDFFRYCQNYWSRNGVVFGVSTAVPEAASNCINLIQHIRGINSSKFTNKLISFCIQAVQGSLMSIYIRLLSQCDQVLSSKTDNNDNNTNIVPSIIDDTHKFLLATWNNGNLTLQHLFIQNMITYINFCWKNYHEKSDDYVVSAVDELLNNSDVQHISCIFHILTDWCRNLGYYSLLHAQKLGRIKIIDENEMRGSLGLIICKVAELQRDNVEEFKKNISCTDKCQVCEYKDNEDFVVISSSSH